MKKETNHKKKVDLNQLKLIKTTTRENMILRQMG